MTTNTNAAQVANNLIAVAEDQAFEAWYKQDCLVGGVNARIAARAAWNARAALTTAAAVPPEGWVMVPVELAQRVQESLGEFLMDHGWSQRDMDTSDDFGAVLLAAAPKAEPVPAGEREELREGASYESMNLAAMVLSDCGHSSNYQPLLERVAGRIDRHVERLLTAQREDLTTRAQAAPAAVASPLTKLQRKAIAVCFTSDKVSVSEVQRKLSISYADAQTLCQSIVDLGLTDELELAPSLKRGAPAPHPAPVAQGDALPREDFAWMVVQEACETEPADEDDPECIRILRRDLKSAVLAAFLREDNARAQAQEGASHD